MASCHASLASRHTTLNLRRVLTFLASLTITAIFLALALASVDFEKLARAIASADYRLVALAALFTLSGNVLRVRRWQRFLASKKQLPVPRCTSFSSSAFTLVFFRNATIMFASNPHDNELGMQRIMLATLFSIRLGSNSLLCLPLPERLPIFLLHDVSSIQDRLGVS
jgi:Lysylphosphatidylglycerol synthase TM region